MVGSAASGPDPAGYQFFYNIVGTTGRTTLQALAVNHLNVVGKATNFTAQRDTTPFGSSLTGMKYIRRATFGGNADAVALDVNGPIGKVTFKRGLGDPTGVFNGKVAVPNTGTSGSQLTQYIPATNYGVPLGSEGYPAHGLLGGVIRAKRIGTVKVGPANYITQTAQNPNFVQLQQNRSPTYYLVNPGTALTNSAITTDGSIGKVQVTGNQLNSEIKTGFDYPSYIAGLQGTRSPSRIRLVRQRGDLVSSVDSATVRPTQNQLGEFRLQHRDKRDRFGLDHRHRHRGRGPWPVRCLVFQGAVSGVSPRHRWPHGPGELWCGLLRPSPQPQPAAPCLIGSRQVALHIAVASGSSRRRSGQPSMTPGGRRRFIEQPGVTRRTRRRVAILLDARGKEAGRTGLPCGRSPPPERRAPVQARAEPGDEQVVAATHAAAAVHLVQGDRYRARRGVSVPFQVLVHGIAIETQDVAGRVDDPDVGLMGNEPPDIADLEPGVSQDRQGRNPPGCGRPT